MRRLSLLDINSYTFVLIKNVHLYLYIIYRTIVNGVFFSYFSSTRAESVNCVYICNIIYDKPKPEIKQTVIVGPSTV